MYNDSHSSHRHINAHAGPLLSDQLSELDLTRISYLIVIYIASFFLMFSGFSQLWVIQMRFIVFRFLSDSWKTRENYRMTYFRSIWVNIYAIFNNIILITSNRMKLKASSYSDLTSDMIIMFFHVNIIPKGLCTLRPFASGIIDKSSKSKWQ